MNTRRPFLFPSLPPATDEVGRSGGNVSGVAAEAADGGGRGNLPQFRGGGGRPKQPQTMTDAARGSSAGPLRPKQPGAVPRGRSLNVVIEKFLELLVQVAKLLPNRVHIAPVQGRPHPPGTLANGLCKTDDVSLIQVTKTLHICTPRPLLLHLRVRRLQCRWSMRPGSRPAPLRRLCRRARVLSASSRRRRRRR